MARLLKLVFALTLFSLLSAQAAAAATFSYQGRLLKSDGTPEVGVVPLTFGLWGQLSGGTAPGWTETQTVALSDGFYSVILGSSSASGIPPSALVGTPYLEVSVNGSALVPRQPVGSVPFGLVSDLPTLLMPASSNVVTSIVVNAKSDCGTIVQPASMIPHMEVLIDRVRIGGADVPAATYSDFTFPVNPATFVGELAVVFTNDNQTGTCDHNLYVDHVTLNGTTTLRSTDTAHALLDRQQGAELGSAFDGIDVLPATAVMATNSALRFFVGASGPMQPMHRESGWTAAFGPGCSVGPTVTFARPFSAPPTVRLTWETVSSAGYCYLFGLPTTTSFRVDCCSVGGATGTANWVAEGF